MPNPFARNSWDYPPNSPAAQAARYTEEIALAQVAPPTPPRLPGQKHAVGYNRPKTGGDLAGQMLYVVLGLAALIFCLGNGYWLGALGVVLFVAAYVSFQEWMSRCEDRTKVKRVLMVLWAILAALEVRHQYQNHQSRERIDAGRRTPEPGVWNPLDYGDR